MNQQEDKIQQLFNATQPKSHAKIPDGHLERFIRKFNDAVEEQPERKRGFFSTLSSWFNNPTAGRKAAWVLSPAICAVAAVLLVKNFSSDDYLNQIELSYRHNLLKLGRELTLDSQSLEQYNQEEALYSISTIVEEDGQLMALQLPDNLSKKEKQRIIKEYYNQKMEGLNKIKTFIAMNNIEEE